MMYILGYLRKHFLQYNTLQFKSLGSVKFFFFLKKCLMLIKAVAQGSSNLSLEGQSAAEFSSNPDQTLLPVIF